MYLLLLRLPQCTKLARSTAADKSHWTALRLQCQSCPSQSCIDRQPHIKTTSDLSLGYANNASARQARSWSMASLLLHCLPIIDPPIIDSSIWFRTQEDGLGKARLPKATSLRLAASEARVPVSENLGHATFT